MANLHNLQCVVGTIPQKENTTFSHSCCNFSSIYFEIISQLISCLNCSYQLYLHLCSGQTIQLWWLSTFPNLSDILNDRYRPSSLLKGWVWDTSARKWNLLDNFYLKEGVNWSNHDVFFWTHNLNLSKAIQDFESSWIMISPTDQFFSFSLFEFSRNVCRNKVSTHHLGVVYPAGVFISNEDMFSRMFTRFVRWWWKFPLTNKENIMSLYVRKI